MTHEVRGTGGDVAAERAGRGYRTWRGFFSAWPCQESSDMSLIPAQSPAAEESGVVVSGA